MNLLIDNDFVKIEKLDNIVSMTWKTDLTDIGMVKNMVDLRLKVTSDLEPYPFIANIKNVKNSTKEIRDFLASKKAAERVTAAAILIDSMVSATIGNFFLRISKPPVTTSIFTNEKDAINWLKKHTLE